MPLQSQEKAHKFQRVKSSELEDHLPQSWLFIAICILTFRTKPFGTSTCAHLKVNVRSYILGKLEIKKKAIQKDAF